ncbi:MAG: gamma-glutamyltransferase [Acidimicrobiia bacterium]|nr:MAG: gamma-glutamyltransferase [Acidimicrobiia bacterium]
MSRPAREAGAALGTGPLDDGTAVAVSSHQLASQAAIDTMTAGGNAVDAAVAANAVLGVVLPDTCGPGGDLFALVHNPGDQAPAALNASGRAGAGASAQRLRDTGHTEIPRRSRDSITVPGCVDGWESLVGRFGARPLADDLATAVGLANEGFPVSEELAASLERLEPVIGDQASAGPLFPEQRPPLPGDIITRPLLAETLAAVASGGRGAFYEGQVGRAITDMTGGIITAEDLLGNQSEWIEPLGTDIMGLAAWTIPPNSQGWLTLATLAIFELLDPPRDPLDPAYHHALIEAYRSVVWERADMTSDPDSASLDPSWLLDEARLADRAEQIDKASAQPWPATTALSGGTTYLTTRDRTGMAVSLIQSNFRGIGTGLSAGATGVWLHDRGDGFTLRPGHPNELSAGRRPLHTLSPTLWTHDGGAALVLGTRGGDQQPQLLAQVAAHHRWAGLCPEDSQSQPRWSITDITEPEPAVLLEGRFAPGTVSGLTERGHSLTEVGRWEAGWGPVSVISMDPDLRAGADPRVSTSAALWAE